MSTVVGGGVGESTPTSLLFDINDDKRNSLDNSTLNISGNEIYCALIEESGLIFENVETKEFITMGTDKNLYFSGSNLIEASTVIYATDLGVYSSVNGAISLDYVNICGPSGTKEGQLSESGTYSYYITDHLGSVRTVVTSSGIEEVTHFNSYGTMSDDNAVRSSDEYREKFTGKEFDTEGGDGSSEGIGLNYFGWRYYDPEVGLWTSVDPEEQFWSGYSYGFDPINGIDSDGLLFNYPSEESKTKLEEWVSGMSPEFQEMFNILRDDQDIIINVLEGTGGRFEDGATDDINVHNESFLTLDFEAPLEEGIRTASEEIYHGYRYYWQSFTSNGKTDYYRRELITRETFGEEKFIHIHLDGKNGWNKDVKALYIPAARRANMLHIVEEWEEFSYIKNRMFMKQFKKALNKGTLIKKGFKKK